MSILNEVKATLLAERGKIDAALKALGGDASVRQLALPVEPAGKVHGSTGPTKAPAGKVAKRVVSEETKAKMRASQAAWRAAKRASAEPGVTYDHSPPADAEVEAAQ